MRKPNKREMEKGLNVVWGIDHNKELRTPSELIAQALADYGAEREKKGLLRGAKIVERLDLRNHTGANISDKVARIISQDYKTAKAIGENHEKENK